MKTCREQPAQAQAIITKYTKATNPKLAEEAYAAFVPTWERVPYINRDAVQALIDAQQNPKARAAKADDFMDNSFLRELEANGFVDSLYKK